MSKILLLAISAGILAGASAREGDLVADEPKAICAADASVQDHSTPSPDVRQVKTASGPLRVHPTNPRYFTDNSGRALYFAGSDTYGLNHKFDEWPTFTGSWSYFVEFLDWMESHNQNFLRCWGGFSYLVSDRHPWQRTGPGSARDGDPKFDMSRFDQSYFDMLKGRLAEIQRRGLHTSITIFGSYNKLRDDWQNTAWHPDNNVNPEIAHTFNPTDPHSFFTTDPEALKIQKLLIAKFVDELNEYDCHIWEIMNETGVAPEIRDWYYGMVEYVKAYEARKPKQHLVGMTPGWDRGKRQPKEWICGSPADWIQIGGAGPADEFATGGSATYTDKLLFLDTDHTPWHTQKNADSKSIQKWVWKTFARGHHPLMLEMYRHGDAMHPDQTRGEINHAYDFVRRALGDTVAYSKRFQSLAQMIPTSAPAQCSTTYCLRNPGQDYLVYQPEEGAFTVNLTAADYEFEWFDPAAGVIVQTGTITAGAGSRTFTPPFSGDAVLYLTLASRGRR